VKHHSQNAAALNMLVTAHWESTAQDIGSAMQLLVFTKWRLVASTDLTEAHCLSNYTVLYTNHWLALFTLLPVGLH
jgi:hypothetical protein